MACGLSADIPLDKSEWFVEIHVVYNNYLGQSLVESLYMDNGFTYMTVCMTGHRPQKA